MTLEELDNTLPNGFHDAEIFSYQVDFARATAKFHLNLFVGWPDDPPSEREEYQEATVVVSGLCFLSIDPPSPAYPFLPDGRPISVSGDPANADTLPSLPDLAAKLPGGTWCYRFFVHDWNAFIYVAARDAQVTWVGEKPKHAA